MYLLNALCCSITMLALPQVAHKAKINALLDQAIQ